MIIDIKSLIMEAAEIARKETGNPEPQFTQKITWPVTCTVGPGLEGAIACESAVGYVNGTAGTLIYRGYDVFDLCAHSTFEEVSFLLLHGHLPTSAELKTFNDCLVRYRAVPHTLRQLMALPIEEMNTMAALRMGAMLLRSTLTSKDTEEGAPDITTAISADEDSIPMELFPTGGDRAIYEFSQKQGNKPLDNAADLHSCYNLIAAMPTIVAAIHRIRIGQMPIEPDPELSHAANFLYMVTGKKPAKTAEKIMDVALILHADHGMNASTFATMIVASCLSDIYFSVGAGIAALNGPLHGGANQDVLIALKSIGHSSNVEKWLEKRLAEKGRVPGFGHRVYKAYDPRARILGPLAKILSAEHPEHAELFRTAEKLERSVVERMGATKKVFPNVDFYSGLVYLSLSLPDYLFTPIFAVSRVAGWTARTREYLEHNRIFRPRAVYTGTFDNEYIPMEKR